jgi:hypothetical protein
LTPRDLAGLVRIAGAACDAAEAKLARLRREEAELRRQIAALEAARQARAAEALATDVALRAGVDLRWEGWIDRRAAGLATDLARLMACIEIARDELSHAFGRRTATEALAEQARAGAAARRLKTEERGW